MSVNVAPPQTKSQKLVEALPQEEARVLKEILLVYSVGDIGTQLMRAIREIDRLGTKIVDGYELPTAELSLIHI